MNITKYSGFFQAEKEKKVERPGPRKYCPKTVEYEDDVTAKLKCIGYCFKAHGSVYTA